MIRFEKPLTAQNSGVFVQFYCANLWLAIALKINWFVWDWLHCL